MGKDEIGILNETEIHGFSQDFLLETKEVWQPLYEKELTVEDAREIASNTVEFFNILVEWDEELI